MVQTTLFGKVYKTLQLEPYIPQNMGSVPHPSLLRTRVEFSARSSGKLELNWRHMLQPVMLTFIVSQWPLRRKSEQDIDSSSCTSQQRYFRARAHFVCLHRKHILSALRHGIIRLRRYIPLPLVRARHHAVCGGA
jgi:hypothetical protein